mmetsp:Transcript_62525/g.177552  ORF Transcript_62525/g.177552 Transcript_62525/m.177552 type:complete len:223 (+) Transcript_62525:1463-2131(+)
MRSHDIAGSNAALHDGVEADNVSHATLLHFFKIRESNAAIPTLQARLKQTVVDESVHRVRAILQLLENPNRPSEVTSPPASADRPGLVLNVFLVPQGCRHLLPRRRCGLGCSRPAVVPVPRLCRPRHGWGCPDGTPGGLTPAGGRPSADGPGRGHTTRVWPRGWPRGWLRFAAAVLGLCWLLAEDHAGQPAREEPVDGGREPDHDQLHPQRGEQFECPGRGI